jgi:hypothetical protein
MVAFCSALIMAAFSSLSGWLPFYLSTFGKSIAAPRCCLRNPVRRRTLSGQQRRGSMHKEAGRIVETPVEARAGFLDRPVLVVLVVSTSLVIALFAVIYLGYFAS